MKRIGKIHIYTGNGKGKTTAALGLALRACGAGMKIFFGQFIKSGSGSEADAVARHLPSIKFKGFGSGRFINTKPSEKEKNLASEALAECEKIVSSGDFDLVVLDEIFPALKAGLIEGDMIRSLIARKSTNTELVLTGRGAPDWAIDMADLVTEMKEVRHYYKEGLKARKGIEF